MSQHKEQTANGLRLYRAFRGRPHGMLCDEAILWQFAYILRGPPYNEEIPSLRDAKDLLTLDIPDDKIEDHEQLLLSLDMGRRPDAALALVANEAKRR